MNLIERYPIYPPDGEETHHASEYSCTLHCECSDHYYRCRDCKHIRAFNAQAEVTE